MSRTEWEQLVEKVRVRVREYFDAGTEKQGDFAARAGVSRSHLNNFMGGRKTPAHDDMGRILEALGLRVLEAAQGLAPSQSIVGSVDAQGVVTFDHDARMGRLLLIDHIADHERSVPKGVIMVLEPAPEPVPDRWNAIQVAGSVRLARAYQTTAGPMIRFAGERVRQEWTPEVHELLGFIAWTMTPEH